VFFSTRPRGLREEILDLLRSKELAQASLADAAMRVAREAKEQVAREAEMAT
jgi:hypothetical protein